MDGTVYVIIADDTRPHLGGAEKVQMTTVAGGPNGILACSQADPIAGQLVSALAGVDPLAGQTLHDFNSILHTGIVTPNNLTIHFDPSLSGRLTVGTGGGAVDICREASHCAGGAPDATLAGLDTGLNGVPPACTAAAVSAPCSPPAKNALGFGLPADASHNCLANPTTVTTVCAAPPNDGFSLNPGQLVVFIYDGSLSATNFSYGLGGFGIDTNGVNNPACLPNSVIVSYGFVVGGPVFPPPTLPPLPVLSSPIAPPGLLLITLLGLAMGWTLTRAARYRGPS
jgi:hypothetical protein